MLTPFIYFCKKYVSTLYNNTLNIIIQLFRFLDSFLRARDSHDHEATAMMKAQFMSLWDGKILFIIMHCFSIT